jgi:hypothetical protein
MGQIVPQDETVPIVSSLGSELSVQDPRPLGESLRRKSVSHKSKEVVTIGESRVYLGGHHVVHDLSQSFTSPFRRNPPRLGGKAQRRQGTGSQAGVAKDHYATGERMHCTPLTTTTLTRKRPA